MAVPLVIILVLQPVQFTWWLSTYVSERTRATTPWDH